MIRIWRRTVLKSWICYYTSGLTGVAARPVFHQKVLDNWVERDTSHTYRWKDSGLEHYRKWHRERRDRKLHQALESAYDCIRRGAEASWWDWDEGSSLIYWRWPSTHRGWAMCGQPHFVVSDLPAFKVPQAPARSPGDGERMREKVSKVRQRRYIDAGPVRSLTHMFCVPKGLDDIRMVYNGTSCGLNDSLWSPHFGLPTVQHTLRSLLPDYCQCDMDVGEMFLNFWLHLNLRPYAGVDVTHVRNADGQGHQWEDGRVRKWERWTRNFMGLCDSPYRSLQLMIKAKYLAYGDRKDRSNPFHWARVTLNLPGAATYNPTLPWVMKVRFDDHLRCEVYICVADSPITG